jgi:hypothetical protein
MPVKAPRSTAVCAQCFTCFSKTLVNECRRTLVLSAYLLKVFCKWPRQKGHLEKIWVGHFIDPLFEIEMQTNAHGLLRKQGLSFLSK